MTEFDKNTEVFLYGLTQKVLKNFKKDLATIQRKKFVTFKNQTDVQEEIFDYYE